MENTEIESRPGVAMTALTHGVIVGILLIMVQVGFYITGNLTSTVSSFVSYAIMLAGIIIATRSRRDRVLGGYIKYGQALGLGTLTIFFASVILGIYVYIFYKFIDPEAINVLMTAAENQMIDRNPNISDDELDMILNVSRGLMTPGFLAVSNIFNFTFLGFVISLITSIFLKNPPPEEF